MTGSHEVSGSIPLISTKTKSHSVRNGFFVLPEMSGARSLRFDRPNLPRESAAAASHMAVLAQKKDLRRYGANEVGGVPIAFLRRESAAFSV